MIMPGKLSWFIAVAGWLLTVEGSANSLHAQEVRFSTPRSFDRSSAVRNESINSAGPAALFAGEYRRKDTAILDKNGVVLQRVEYGYFLAIDREGNLYIANPYGSLSVLIYAPPYNGKPTRVTPAHGEKITSVNVDPKSDIFVITTQANFTHGGPGELRFYRHGETQPCRVVPPQHNLPTFYGGGAFDAEDNFFFPADNGNVVIASTPGGCLKASISQYSFGNVIFPYGNMAFDAHDNFVIQGWVSNGPGPLYTYAHPVNGSFGLPLSVTPLPSYQGRGSLFLAMDSTGSSCWGSFLRDAINRYQYPAGGHEVQSIRGLDYVDGLAVYPNYLP